MLLKRLLAVTLLLGACQMMMAGQFIYDNIVYEYWNSSKKECTLVKVLGSPREIDIPETVVDNGKKLTVTVIGYAAFRESSVVKVSMPNTINEIGGSAFSSSDLEEIVLSESITEISYGMFSFTKLKSVKIPKSVTKIRGSAFSDCALLTNVELPDGVTEIESLAFYNCKSLSKIALPADLKMLGESVLPWKLV